MQANTQKCTISFDLLETVLIYKNKQRIHSFQIIELSCTELHLYLSSTTEQNCIRYNKNLKGLKHRVRPGTTAFFNASIVYYKQFSEGYCSCIMCCMKMQRVGSQQPNSFNSLKWKQSRTNGKQRSIAPTGDVTNYEFCGIKMNLPSWLGYYGYIV